MKHGIIIVTMILSLCFGISDWVFGKEQNDLPLGCISGVLIDGETGRVLYEKNGHEKRAMASTTKIMTCILALERCNQEEIVTVSKKAVNQPKVRMNVKVGEQYVLKDLLYALMLESYNDVAVAVAEHVGGSVEGFSRLMNRKAKEIGMTESHFVTPNGLDAKKHYSTAYDMTLLGAYAIKNPMFLKIIGQKEKTIRERNHGRRISLYNRDGYLAMDPNAIGIKTGFTNQAGYCFVGATKNRESQLISCVLGSGWPPSKNQKWKDTKQLMDFGRKVFHRNHVEMNQIMLLHLNNGTKSLLRGKCQGSLDVLKTKREKIKYENCYFYKLPVRKNQVIGYTKVYINDFYFGSIEIRSLDDIPKYDYSYCFQCLWNLFI